MITALLSFGKIILVDLIMSGDNAIIIAFATKNLKKKIRNKAIYMGIAGAAILRIILASVALFLLQYSFIQYFWWLLLLYVAWNFFRTLKLGSASKKITAKAWLRWAVWVIIMADFSLSLDNVLAVASIAENIWILALGLIASITMMMFASKAITKLMEKYEWIQRWWLLVIIHTALNILMGSDIHTVFLTIPVSIRGLLIMFGIITYLYTKNVVHVAFHLRKHHLHNHVRLWIIAITFLILLSSDFIPEIRAVMHMHLIEWMTILFVNYMMLLELIMQQYSIDKYYLKHQSRH